MSTSAQADRNEKPAAIPRPGRASGATISTRARSLVRPSSHDASSSCLGTESKKPFMSQTRNGSSIAAWMRMSPR